MKVFISWSGKDSRQVAQSFRELLPYMFERIEPFASFEDIRKGEQGKQKILEELKNTNFGIICLTSESVNAPWVNFEAGALAKTSDSQIYTFLFGISRKNLQNSPLEDFQSTSYSKEDIRRLMISMNKEYDLPLKDSIFNDKFEYFWEKLEVKLTPLYDNLKKHAFFVLEEEKLNIDDEKQNVEKYFSNLTIKKYSVEEISNISTQPSLMIYFYSQSNNSLEKLKIMIDYLKTQPLSPSLIIYTLNNKKLNDDEYAISKHHAKIANFPETLIDRCKDVLN